MDIKRFDWLMLKVRDVDLNTWEEGFIDNMTELRQHSGEMLILSEAQEDTLERIAAK